ncbi:MAG: ATP-dependent helicase [Lachnospiraceae bacterium]|nr:ATP-dependent helicase [Lachnospiraceae bacterium]
MAFNQTQIKAVDHFQGPMLVLAGPGSGKTTVITHRTKKLIEEYEISPSNILVITFTKAAATEMQQRFYSIMGGKRPTVTFGTFHAVFFKILKYAYNYNAANILREEKKHDILKEIINYQRLEIDDENEFISNIISEISIVKGDMLDIDHYYSKNCSESIFRKIFSQYNNKLIRSNLIDFDDMLVMCYELLTKREDILRIWQNKYQYVLIDEFQDISRLQYEIIKLLAAPCNNIFVVGDDDQSIYRFRGARPEIMESFVRDYKNVKNIILDTNYRSNNSILDASMKLITHNKVRFKKQINSVRNSKKPVNIRSFENQPEECMYILNEINSAIKGGLSYKDIAVLYRTNTNPRLLAEKLMDYNIPFKMKDALPNIYNHFLARDIISYIKIAMGDDSRKEYLNIINRPKRYISREAFSTPVVDLEELKEYYEDKNYVVDRINHFEYDIMMLEKMTPYAAISYIRRGIGYDEFVEEYADTRRINKDELMDILDELEEAARGHKTYQEWFKHIEEYSDNLKKQASKQNENEDAVELATMHGSKGLEYKTVFIMDVNEGVSPYKKALLDADIEEERRLFYVAMTRAKDELNILYVKERFGKKVKPSRFIKEIVGDENETKAE